MSHYAERRRATRQRVYLAAQIVGISGGSAHPVECAVRSISATGANLRAPSSAPATFDLRLVREGASRRARTVWAYGDQRGIAFEDAQAETAPKRLSILALRSALRVVETDAES